VETVGLVIDFLTSPARTGNST